MGAAPETFLFHCDTEWIVLGAGAYSSVESAEDSAAIGYDGISAKWTKSRFSQQEAEQFLTESWGEVHAASGETYGSPRVTRALRRSGYTVGENRVARLMQERRLKARAARLYRANPVNHAFFTSIPNRQLAILAQQPDQVWVGDITYLKVGTVWRYLAVVMDKWSRRIVGWSLGRHRYANLTLRALDRAVANRRPRAGLIFHTDRGIEYAAHAFRQRLARLGFIQSMNRPQRMNDNAHMESFFHSLTSESIHGKTFVDDREAIAALRSYLPYYNHSRLHSSLNYVSPATYEQQPA